MSQDSDLVWHYTSSIGLQGILTEHKLRATSVSFVNDPTEQSFGLDAVLSALGHLATSNDRDLAAAARAMSDYRLHGVLSASDHFGFSERMVACVSRTADSLEMWRAYGAQNLTGTFAVGLDPNVALGPLFEDEAVLEAWREHWGRRGAMPQMRNGWVPMLYLSPDNLRDHALTELRRGLEDLDLTAGAQVNHFEYWHLVDEVVADIEARFKHNAYAAEHELRLQAELTSSKQFKLQPNSHGISAFLELTASEEWGCPTSAANRLPVREIVLWPGAPRQALGGVAAALIKGGHNYSLDPLYRDPDEAAVVLRVSEIPFV